MPKHVRKEQTGSTVEYLDSKGLTRPQELPKSQFIIVGVFVLAAAIIGFFLLQNAFDTMYFSAAKKQATVKEIIAVDPNLSMPSLPAAITQSDEELRSWMQSSGFTSVEMGTDSAGNIVNFDVIKLPAGVTLLEAQLDYAKGVSSLSADEIARLLHGSWRLTVERSGPVTMTIHYADFTSGSLDQAIKTAMAAQGLDTSTLGDSGVDSMGNTYQTGTVISPQNGGAYSWQVSVIPLSDVYSVSGLPDDAVYVGIRISQ